MLLKKGVAFRRWFFLVGYNSTSALSLGANISLQPDGLTGLTVNVQIAKDGTSSFSDPAVGSLNLTEASDGWYYADFDASDSNTSGPLKYQLSWSSGSNTYGEQDQVVLDLPGGSVSSVSGSVDSVTGNVGGNILGSVISNVNGDLGDAIIIQGAVASATSSTLTAANLVGTVVNNVINGNHIRITSGTGLWQERVVTGFTSSTGTVTLDRAWTTTPDNTSHYQLRWASSPKLNASLEVVSASVTGNIGGSVATVSAITTSGGKVSGVVLVDTCTTNIDMRGTNNAALAGSSPSWYTAPVDVSANVTAIKAKTDSLTFAVAGKIDCNVLYVNGVQIKGAGVSGNTWGPV